LRFDVEVRIVVYGDAPASRLTCTQCTLPLRWRISDAPTEAPAQIVAPWSRVNCDRVARPKSRYWLAVKKCSDADPTGHETVIAREGDSAGAVSTGSEKCWR
jgi:hypothetical protein